MKNNRVNKTNSKFTPKNFSGFTLVELLVSISIMALLTSVFLVNYKIAGARSDLIMAAQTVASDLRLAQNRSLASAKKDGVIPDGGWGVYFDKNTLPGSYIIFADLEPANHVYDEGEMAQTINLPKNITLSHLESIANVVFTPPEPITYLNGEASGNLEIILTDGKTAKKVTVNSFGLIDVAD